MDHLNDTLKVSIEAENDIKVKETFKVVYEALKVKGYNPINQIVAYIMSGDPTFITGYNNARNLMSKLEPDEILEILVKEYIKTL
jgi:uncharacterized protein (UPF0297 family)